MDKRDWDFIGDGRRHSRWDVDAHADIAGNEVLLFEAIEDISLGGMRIQTGSPSPLGHTVSISLTTAGRKTPLQLQGVVAWTDQSGYTGIRFAHAEYAGSKITEKNTFGELDAFIAMARRRRVSRADVPPAS